MRKNLLLLMVLFSLTIVWAGNSFERIYFDTDLGRDLYELSNIWLGKVVWLGPRLSIGYHASPIYYYLLFPLLWLTRGDANSIFVTNLILALFSLGVFAVLGYKRYRTSAIWATITTGLSPLWITVASHPGNGFTYAIWSFLALTSIWFDLPLSLSSFLFGLAIAHHPGAVFIFPFLFYRWWQKGHSLRSLLIIMFAVMTPWSPIILFEILTKGYLIREFLTHPSVGLSFPPPIHYFFGIGILSQFFLIVFLLQKKWGYIVLAILAILLIWKNISPPKNFPERTISKMESNVDKLIASGTIEKDKRLALVAALGEKASSPQADDYRFFLRLKGYQVLEVNQYSQADYLVMFIEYPGFNWQNWSTWEIEQAGRKKEIFQTKSGKTKIIVFQSK